MSFEYAANPNKMASYLSSFNSANLGKVANTGTIQDTMTDVNTVLNNAFAEDTKNEMYYKGLASEANIDHRAEMARMEMDANRTNAFIDAGTSAVTGAIKGSGFSLFGDKGGKDAIPLGLGDGTDKAALTPGIDLRSDRDILLNPVAGYGSNRYGNVMNG